MIRDDYWTRRGLCRLPDSGWVAGVCAGLAERLAVGAGLVRILFVLLALGGMPVLACLVYAALAVLVPARPLLADSGQYRRFRR